MKALIVSIFALTLIGATGAGAEGVGAGVHIGNVGVGVHAGSNGRHHQRHRRCVSWRYRHHERYCRRWSY